MIPVHEAARKLGMTTEQLVKLCDDEMVLDAEHRGTGDRAQWWLPNDPVVLQVRDRLSVRVFVPEGTVPLIVAARRDGIAPHALTRLCRLGRVKGARKVYGQWFIPADVRVDKPKRGRQRIQWPDWLNNPMD